MPGTIIDAYAAGIPVLASKWKSFGDVVIDGVTGYGYNFGREEELKDILDKIIHNPDIVICLKPNCLKYATYYLPENALKPIYEKISGQ